MPKRVAWDTGCVTDEEFIICMVHFDTTDPAVVTVGLINIRLSRLVSYGDQKRWGFRFRLNGKKTMAVERKIAELMVGCRVNDDLRDAVQEAVRSKQIHPECIFDGVDEGSTPARAGGFVFTHGAVPFACQVRAAIPAQADNGVAPDTVYFLAVIMPATCCATLIIVSRRIYTALGLTGFWGNEPQMACRTFGAGGDSLVELAELSCAQYGVADPARELRRVRASPRLVSVPETAPTIPPGALFGGSTYVYVNL
jgi:hypothetical protein